jgi:hypothetical protein
MAIQVTAKNEAAARAKILTDCDIRYPFLILSNPEYETELRAKYTLPIRYLQTFGPAEN